MDKIKLTKKELEGIITNVAGQALDAKIKELNLDQVDRKFGMFPAEFAGKTQDELTSMKKKERVATFIKAVFHKDTNTLASFKALNEGTGSAGGFSVPEEFAAEINRIAEDFGLVRKLSRTIPMNSDTMNVPRLATGVTVSFPGEGVAGTPSQFVEANVQLLAKTAVGLTVASNELLADANISIVDFLTELFGEALAGEEDSQGFAGTGAPFTGILEDAGVNVVDLGTGDVDFTDADLTDYRDMITQVKPLALQGAAYFLNKTVWADIQKETDSQGAFHLAAANPVLTPGATAGVIGGVVVGALWGYPVYLSEKMPATTGVSTKFAIFGNLRHLWFGNRQMMTMTISDAASVGADNVFEQNQSAMRVTERIAISVGLPDAFAVLKTAAV